MKQVYYFKGILLFIICTLVVSCREAAPQINTDKSQLSVEVFQAILDSIYQANPQSIGVIAHVESPKNGISWSGSAGYADNRQKDTLRPDQPALIASSIKTYVAAAILRLQEEGQLNIEDAIGKHLSKETIALFEQDGYQLDKIKIKHLLSHTSGIADYVNDDYFEFIDNNQTYRWTREEQLALATKVGDPLSVPQTLFQYADVNYLLATEIIEQHAGQPFYRGMRQLLKYDQLKLTNTWFPTLEDKPKETQSLVHQYWNVTEWGARKMNISWDSKAHDISWDLYGGGGIATTMKELAQFSHHLFNKKIVEDEAILKLMTTDVVTTDGIPKTYRLGISDTEIKGLQSFGHGGFWGTIVFYIPQLETSISVCVLEREGKMKVIRSILNTFVNELSNQMYLDEMVETASYTLYKAKNSKATLILYPGGGTDASYTKQEFDIVNLANANQVSVAMMNFNRHIWIDKATTTTLAQELEQLLNTHQLDVDNIFIGGMSIGGNVALSLSDYLLESKSTVQPKGVFVVDSPIDLSALYQSALKDVSNPDLDAERLEEPRFIVNYFEEEFTKENVLVNVEKVSPFIHEKKYIGVANLENCRLRFYTEPDADWWMKNRRTVYENTNAYVIQEVVKDLQTKGWSHVELIETENKGYRSNGERHPHSWSIVDMGELVDWMMR